MSSSLITVSSIVKATPESNLKALAKNARKHLKDLEKPKITSEPTLLALSDSIKAAIDFMENSLDSFLTRGREATAQAWQMILPDENLTVRVQVIWPLRAQLDAAISLAKQTRAQYLDGIERKRQDDQRKKDDEQRKINEKNAKEAAANAAEHGADRETQKEIAQSVLSTPAPEVAARVQAPSNVTLSYNYGAQVTSFRALLTGALSDVMLFNLLDCDKVRWACESVLRPLATAQKDRFKVPGCELKKTPKDIQR
ncbi:MAG TPA: hypothetical protein VET48_04480 [Steroidobacteraceae bacterium]|nr:hypothetical protein [Steroidobacteraceae bacterium]